MNYNILLVAKRLRRAMIFYKIAGMCLKVEYIKTNQNVKKHRIFEA